MKIIQIFPGKVWGGAEQYVLDLGSALENRGNTVGYVCCDVEAVTSRLSGVKSVTALPFGGIFDRKTIPALTQLVADADLIHIHDARFMAPVMKAVDSAHRSEEVKIVLTRHIARDSRAMPWQRKKYRRLHRMIFVSELAMNLWHGVNQWMDLQKCRVVRNSIPTESSSGPTAESARQRFNIAPDCPMLMFTGRVRRSKGCATIVEALSKIKDLPWEMVFVGACKPADYDQRLLNIAKQNGIADRIHFYGFSRNVRALVEESDIGLAPSIVREACPLSPMEFMQAGRPVIASNNGAQPEYISNEIGALIDPDNVPQLAEALRNLLANPELRKAKGNAARDYFDTHMSYSTFVDRIIDAYTN